MMLVATVTARRVDLVTDFGFDAPAAEGSLSSTQYQHALVETTEDFHLNTQFHFDHNLIQPHAYCIHTHVLLSFNTFPIGNQ